MLGASPLGSVFRETKESESLGVVNSVVKNGINLIDTSPWYGHGKSETVLGKVTKIFVQRMWCDRVLLNAVYTTIGLFALAFLTHKSCIFYTITQRVLYFYHKQIIVYPSKV